MPLKIKLDDNEFTLSDDCLKEMATAFWHTKVKERGFMLCQDTEITPSPEHIGGQGSIRERNCRGKPRVGYYHTHPPPATSHPSWWDAYSILASSHRDNSPQLGCRGGKADGQIRCDTVKKVPNLAIVQELKRKRARMRFTSAEDDPEIWRHFATPYSFPARQVPEMIKPPVQPPLVPAPEIKVEELVFAGSAFMRYTNLETGEVRVERVY